MRLGAPVRMLAVLLLCGCASIGRGRPPGGPPLLRALLLNGGGTARTNYYSHFLHLGAMHRTLTGAGIPAAHIDVLSSDGASTAPDVAMVRAAEGPDAWLLDGTVLERPLGRPLRYVSASMKGMAMAPATLDQLNAWFDDGADQLIGGDTLLLFVTDHGEKGKTPQQSRITLWNRQSITVAELARRLGELPTGVRVVTVMTQCYSGGFAEAALDDRLRSGRPAGATCGYYSTTADRQAYGCYPDADTEHDGYAIRFAQALRRSSSLPAAHVETLSTDRTPDVPLRSSDLFLARLVERTAAQRGVAVEELVSSLTATALEGGAEEVRVLAQQIDEVAGSFAIPVPRQPGELATAMKRLQQLRDRLNQNVNSWESAVGELAQANLEQYLATQGGWADWLAPRELARLPQSRLRSQQQQVVTGLAAFTRGQAGRMERLQQGHIRVTASRASRDRAEVRMAALLRLRALLTSLVGQHLLATEGNARDRAALAALRGCEDLRLPVTPPVAPPPVPAKFPSIENDERLAVGGAPAVLGATLIDVPPEDQNRQRLPAGAMAVVGVEAGSPAARAGLTAGDILVGEAGAPAVDRGSLKLQLAVGQNAVRELDVVRGGRRLVVAANMPRVAPDGSPDKELPAARRIALRTLTAFRGDVNAALPPRRPVLLFFWATWCTFCKFAVPELMALERERGIQVLSITDENSDTIKQFLGGWGKPFPQLVALDPERKVNEAFEVEGYPTFLLVDERGRVRMHSVGYRRETGLPLAGWTFAVEGGVAGGVKR
jgi:thiol-disulfide isomerase/thioredoxin